MQEEIEDLKDPAALESAYGEAIRRTRSLLATEKDETRVAVLQSALRRNRCGLEELPRFAPRLPDVTFGSEMVLKGEKRSVTFRPLPPAHTNGDCLMQIDGEPILFLGDIGFFKTHPFMVGCDPIGWIHQLEELEKSVLGNAGSRPRTLGWKGRPARDARVYPGARVSGWSWL